MKTSSLILLAVFVLFVPGLNTRGHRNKTQTQTSEGELRVLAVTVRNGAGKYVSDVPRDAFELTDEKEKRPIEFFENADTPLSIGILIDTSRSVRLLQSQAGEPWKQINDALTQFLKSGNIRNEYFLMSFDKAPHLLADWQSGQSLLSRNVDIGPPGYATALYDACFTGIEKLQSGRNPNRALILFSDGLDNLSRHTFNQLRDSLKDSELMLYGVGLMQGNDVGSSLGIEGSGVMDELAETTGGETSYPKDKKELAKLLELLASEMRHQYRIGFRTDKSSHLRRWHRLKLKVVPQPNAAKEFSKLTVRTRQGYYPR